MIETVNPISMDALKAGDRDAFAQFVDETSAHVYRVAVKILGNEQDAEDVLQETYLKAFRSLRDFEGRSSLATWIYRIAVNEGVVKTRLLRARLRLRQELSAYYGGKLVRERTGEEMKR